MSRSVKFLKDKSLILTRAVKDIYAGPVSNSWLVSREFVKLVTNEQQIKFPSANDFALAKETYSKALERIFPPKDGDWIKHFDLIRDLTWAEFTTGGRVALELAAFYYIGSLLGGCVALPLSIF